MKQRRNTLKFVALGWLLIGFGIGGFLWAAAPQEVPGFDVVYPPSDSALIFSHRIHKGFECATCHKEAQTSSKAADRLIPTEAICGRCHANQVRTQVNEAGTAARCATCHRDYKPDNSARPDRVNWPTANLVFSHQTHVQRMMKCESCHIGVADSDQSGGRHLPREAHCLSCHGGKRSTADCNQCHPDLPSGEMQTDFKGKKLIPSSGVMNHFRDWTRRHAKEAAYQERSCKTCHQQRFCNACHDGVMKPMKIHPEDYATMHSIDARKNRNKCSSCHRYQSFCVDCHTKMGVSTKSELKSRRAKIHPDGFGDCQAGPNHHGFQAKRSLSSCVSCHTEEDCLRCHQVGAPCGGGVRIHRHMSKKQLSRMKKQNSRACKKCHGDNIP